MNIGIFSDNSLALPIANLVSSLNQQCSTLRFHHGSHTFRIEDPFIVSPSTYENLTPDLWRDIEQYDLAVLPTAVPYHNNFFYELINNAAFVSFHGWNQLTDLPITNGLVYITVELIAGLYKIGKQHETNTGCLNDFLWDKRGIDVGMRAAYICKTCLSESEADSVVIRDITHILDLVSRSSRIGNDVAEHLAAIQDNDREGRFDVFLCHNSHDKPEVRQIYRALTERGLRPWLDEEHLPIGRPWQPELENCISKINAAAVLVGDNGIGPWQDPEIRAFLNEFTKRQCPVIPVILRTATSVPTLPLFLQAMTWIDLRNDSDKNLERIARELIDQRDINLQSN